MKALIIAAQGVQDVELAYPFYRLQEAGFEVSLAAPDAKEFTGIAGVKFKPTQGLLFDWPRKDLEEVDLLVLPGGVKAMEILRLNDAVIKFIADFHASNKVIAAICSGVQLLISAKVVRGMDMTIYDAHAIDLSNAGAIYTNQPAVADSNIVTSPHYRNLGDWMALTLAVFYRWAIMEGKLSRNQVRAMEGLDHARN